MRFFIRNSQIEVVMLILHSATVQLILHSHGFYEKREYSEPRVQNYRVTFTLAPSLQLILSIMHSCIAVHRHCVSTI